jgi:formylglycine-generating enzyme required for sulfatase activity
MHGNVWEWCEDTLHRTYTGAPSDGSAWTEGGARVAFEEMPYRVHRGGDWNGIADECRSAGRDRYLPYEGIYDTGFRPAFSTTKD